MKRDFEFLRQIARVYVQAERDDDQEEMDRAYGIAEHLVDEMAIPTLNMRLFLWGMS